MKIELTLFKMKRRVLLLAQKISKEELETAARIRSSRKGKRERERERERARDMQVMGETERRNGGKLKRALVAIIILSFYFSRLMQKKEVQIRAAPAVVPRVSFLPFSRCFRR